MIDFVVSIAACKLCSGCLGMSYELFVQLAEVGAKYKWVINNLLGGAKNVDT